MYVFRKRVEGGEILLGDNLGVDGLVMISNHRQCQEWAYLLHRP